MLVEKVEYPSGLDYCKYCNHGATYYSEFVDSSSSGKSMALVYDHMLTRGIQKSNESCSYGKYNMALDLSLVLVTVEVCFSKSEFALLDKMTYSQSSHHYFYRQLHDP